MEITFEVPSTESRTIQVQEEDLALLNDIIRHLAIRHLEVSPLALAYFPEEKQVVELCLKYGIDPEQKGGVVNFFRALLLNPAPQA